MLRYPLHADMHLTTYKYPNSSNTSWGSEWGPGTRDNWPNSRKEQGPLHMGSGPLSIMIWYIHYFEHNVRNFKSIYAKSFVFWQEKETEQYFCKMWKTFEGPFKVYWVRAMTFFSLIKRGKEKGWKKGAKTLIQRENFFNSTSFFYLQKNRLFRSIRGHSNIT